MSYENTWNLHESSQETCWAPSNAKEPECGTESKGGTQYMAHYLRQGRWDSGTGENWAEPLLTLTGHAYRLRSWELGLPCPAYPADTSMSLSQLQKHVAVTASEVFLEFSFLAQAPRSWWAGPLNLTRTNTERWRPDSCFSVRGHEIPLHSRGKRGFARDFLGRGNHLWTETSTSIYYSALSHLSGKYLFNI